MSDYEVPVGWKFYDSKSNQTIFTGPGHTVNAPYLLIFDRTEPQSNGPRVPATNPRMRVRVIRGHVDGDGNPIIPRTVSDFTVRWSTVATISEVEETLAMLGSILTSAAFQDDAIREQLLPRSVAAA